jgi:hypothetical protein
MERSEFVGADFISGTTTFTGRYGAITAVAAAVLDAATVAADYGGDSLASLPIPAGTTIYGTFTTVKLTSGKVIAYKI